MINYFAGATLTVVIGADVIVVIMVGGGGRGVTGVAGVAVVVIVVVVVVVGWSDAGTVHYGRDAIVTIRVADDVRRIGRMGVASPGDRKSECRGRCCRRYTRRHCGAILDQINPLVDSFFFQDIRVFRGE